MSGNLLDRQQENNRPTTMTSIQHCICNWEIRKISFCLVYDDFFFKGSTFDLIDGSKWCLGLNINYRRNVYNFYPQIFRVPGESNLEQTTVRFRLTLQLSNGSCLWSLPNEVFTFTEEGKFVRVFKIKRSILQGLINEERDNDTLVFMCEMMAVVVTNVIWRNGINCHLDTQDLSRNLFKLLEDNLLTNIVLLVEGKWYIKAHKEILSIWSNKFTELMETSNHSLEIPSYTFEVVKAMLIFLYSGDVNVLAINDPPAFELYECAEYYGIGGLTDLLQPRRICEVTTITTWHYRCTWDILDFLTLYAAKNAVHKGERFLQNSEVKLRLDFKRDGGVTFYIKVCEGNPESVILNDITISDAFSNNLSTKRVIKPVYDGKECTFKLSLDSFDYSTLNPPHDALSVRCDFTYILLPMMYSCIYFLPEPINEGSTWNTLSSQMRERFWKLPHTDMAIDVLCSNTIVRKPAHKSVLSARSPVIKALLNCKNGGRLVLRCSTRSANALLYYMYTGTLRKCSVRTLIDLHNFACRFWIPLLRDKCFRLLHYHVTCLTACKICFFADCHKYEYLKSLCFGCIFQHQNLILGSYKWRAISRNRTLEQEVITYIATRNGTMF